MRKRSLIWRAGVAGLGLAAVVSGAGMSSASAMVGHRATTTRVVPITAASAAAQARCVATVTAAATPAYQKALASYKALGQPKPDLTEVVGELCPTFTLTVKTTTSPGSLTRGGRALPPTVTRTYGMSVCGNGECWAWEIWFNATVQYDQIWVVADGQPTCNQANYLVPFSISNEQCGWNQTVGGWAEPTPNVTAWENYEVSAGALWFNYTVSHSLAITVNPDGTYGLGSA